MDSPVRRSVVLLARLQHKNFSTSTKLEKVTPKNLKGKGKSSQDWLTRQLNDPYVKLARSKQYRARSAFKLLEINEQHKILRPGQVVVECGAAPGAWTQVAVAAVNSLPDDNDKPQGVVVAVDLQSCHPLPGATLLQGHDFTKLATQKAVLSVVQDQKIDVVLSDMAPSASGVKELDHENIMTLVYTALQFAVQHSSPGSSFLCKVWDGYKNQQLWSDLKKFYKVVKVVKPAASRRDSAEAFYLGKNYVGLGKKD